MKNNYEALLKEQVMQNLLGNSTFTLQDFVKKLAFENKKDIHEISQAYFMINREVLGDSLAH